ncbi:MAG: SDR family oxidoreductase [Thermoflexales bacterium]|nr:SDR family oxidoreductase [Thermoflexales bacterium]MDW8351262.1 SDR family oxidoreductase [Anaerolineae bacterium]
MDVALNGKVVAIAGATGGLGPTVAHAFARAGAALSLVDRDAAKLDALVMSLGASPEKHQRAAMDLLDPGQAQGWAAQIQHRYGQVDAVLHLVGGYRGGQKIAQFPQEDWLLLKQLLVETTWNVIRAFAEPLKTSRGRFILVSSPQAQKPSHVNAAYAACKAAAEALTLALADEFRGSGATANVIVVNAILTASMRAEKPDADYSAFTTAEDIADAMLYLCSPAAANMNGQRLSLFGAR